MDVILLVWVAYSRVGLTRDTPDGIQSTVGLLADDTIAYVTISSDADAANLQQDLDKLAEWE
jgi:hypothetical protein